MTTPTNLETLTARCCIVGGGPAGMVLGFLLARAGVDVLVLEKHSDFLRDFRGDTVHPSTLEIMYELGILNDFLQLPHQELHEINAQSADVTVPVADFSHLPTHCKFIALMPQWDFLNFIAAKAKAYPQFRLRMEAEVTDLLHEGEKTVGVLSITPQGSLEVRADLVVGADGRRSVVRQRAGLEILDFGSPIDVLWLRISKYVGDPPQSLGRFNAGKIFIMLDRGDYWQCGFVIPKGAFADVQQRGLDSFRDDISRLAPFVSDRVGEISDWKDVSLLTVRVDRLRRWDAPNLLCIGDAAHAMSPVGGVGINLAIQDAVATANLLALPLREGAISADQLQQVQQRREWPTRVIQRLQVLIQQRVIRGVLKGQKRTGLAWPLRLLQRWPALRLFPAWLIGIGVRPEHVKTPDVKGASNT